MRRIGKRTGGILAVTAALALGIGISQLSPAAREPDVNPAAAPSQTEPQTPTPADELAVRAKEDSSSAEPEAYTTTVHEYIPPYSLDQLLEESTLVVRGRVTEASAPFLIRNASRTDQQTYTDYRVEAEEILRGEAVQDEITVRMEGNPQDDSVVYLDAPVLEEGKEYLLFLQKHNIGGGFHTGEDCYYIHGSRQGVYEPVEFSAAKLQKELLVSQENLLKTEDRPGEPFRVVHRDAEELRLAGKGTDDGVLEWEALVDKAAKVNTAVPVDEDFVRKELEKNLRSSTDSGFLTEEEYESLLAELDQYAEIVK